MQLDEGVAPCESNIYIVRTLWVCQKIMISQGISSMWMEVERYCGKMDGTVKWMRAKSREMYGFAHGTGQNDGWVDYRMVLEP